MSKEMIGSLERVKRTDDTTEEQNGGGKKHHICSQCLSHGEKKKEQNISCCLPLRHSCHFLKRPVGQDVLVRACVCVYALLGKDGG